MENGVEIVNEQTQLREVKMAVGDENLVLGSVDGDAGESLELKDESIDSEENDVFEEAMDNESFHISNHHGDSDSQGVLVNGEGNGEVSEEANWNPSLEQEAEKFDEPTDAQVSDGSPEGIEAASSEEKKEDFDEPDNTLGEEDGKDAMPIKLNGVETEGAIGGVVGDVDVVSSLLVDGGERIHGDQERELMGEMSQNGEFDEANANGVHAYVHENTENGDSHEVILDDGLHAIVNESVNGDSHEVVLDDGLHAIVNESENGNSHEVILHDGLHAIVNESENGESHEVVLDETGLKHGNESKEQIHQDGIQQLKDALVDTDTPLEVVAGHMNSENLSPLKDLAETDNEIKPDMCTSEAKEGAPDCSHITGRIEVHPEQDMGETPSSGSKSPIREELEEESVLVEDLGESSSTDDDDNKTYGQQVSFATSRPEDSGGPPLPSRPAGLGSSAPLLEPVPRSLQQSRANGSASQRQSQHLEEPVNGDADENDETREKLQMIRVKFLRLAHRLGQTPHNVVVAQVLYRLGLAEQLRSSRNTNRAAFSFDRASAMAEQLETAGQEPLDFSCTILVIGKTGVGKSATINSIFDEVKFRTNAFQMGTKKVQDYVGMVQGIKVRVIDTPGLLPSSSDQCRNEKILHSVNKFIKKTPPDIVLYFDRLDMQSRDYGDVPLLRTITGIFGTSIWFNAIVVLTHAASAPPDGPNGTPLSYEMFVTQRSHVVQQAIRQAAGDVRLMNPVSLVENHSACRMNRAGQRVLPNGQVWKPQLLLLSFASKILAEANMLLKLQDNPPGKPFGTRPRVPPLPFLLSSLLQSRPQLKLPEDQFGEEDAMDEESDDSGDEPDFDELPPFKYLTKAQLTKLSKAQKKAYFEEIDYREKLFFKKQLKEEKKRRKLMKKMAESAKDLPNNYNNENVEDESSGQGSVQVPLPDLVLPASFDSDNPTHRYRSLESSNQWIVHPVLESQGWDHDVGYEGLNVERLFVVKDKIPISVSGQLMKDKKDCTLQMELASSFKHSEGKATSMGLDMQTVGKDMAYTLRADTRFNNFRRNNTALGLSATILGDAVTAGVKIEDRLIVHKRFRLLMTGGAMTGRGDVAYGGRLEATLRDKDYPLGRALSSLALSVVDWHGDLALGCNLQSQIPLGRGTNVIGHANLSNRGSGQVGIRLNSSEHLQIALLALVPLFQSVKRMLYGSSQSM